MKHLLLMLLVLTLAVAGKAQREVIDKVIATVGGELVLLSELEEQHALMKDQSPQMPADARCAIMDGILITKLLLHRAKVIDSIEVTEEEVEAQLDTRIQRILDYMNGDVSQFETYYGQSIGEVKEQFREDLRSQLLVERMRSKILGSIKVTPAEVKAFFAKIPTDSMPYFNSEVEVGEIVYKPKINEEEKQKAIDKLEGIRKSIVEDTLDFGELARKNSDDFGSARAGGDLGWARRGKFVPAFEAAAYKLEKNELSPVIESDFGFHLIQMLERRGNSIHVRHILIRPQITDNDLELAKRHLDSIRLLVVKDSLSFSEAVKKFSDKNVQSYNNDGRMVNSATGNTFFEISDLEPDIFFALDTMKVEGLSAPFEFRMPNDDVAFRVVQLQSRSAPHYANLRQDYSKILQAANEAKKNEFIETWVSDKVSATFVDLETQYLKGCPNLDRWVKKSIRP